MRGGRKIGKGKEQKKATILKREKVLRADKEKNTWKSKYASGRDDKKRARERVMEKKIAVVVKEKEKK